ncbi:MAG: 30S ribosomal protein S5 [Candidatus Jorgensenbacteria bacterium]|nr:30S ribosomal protein S5 [Candidatus Jorgensenbacteria bacterium]
MRRTFSKNQKSEFKEKVLEVRRVTRVMAGGKRFSFRATVVLGDQKGRVGLGIAKGLDFSSSVDKARRQAEKNIVMISLIEGRTVPYETEAKYGAAHVRIKSAKKGHGLIAGGSCRTVLELVGVRDVSAKILGRTKNKIANALATIEALKQMDLTPRSQAVEKSENI